jgi:hypothetical protein
MKNVSSTSSFSLNEYYESVHFSPASSLSESVIQASQQSKEKHESEKKKKKAEERCGNGKNTSNYIENMIILCRFLCFRFIKPFCRYTSPSCHTCSV